MNRFDRYLLEPRGIRRMAAAICVSWLCVFAVTVALGVRAWMP